MYFRLFLVSNLDVDQMTKVERINSLYYRQRRQFRPSKSDDQK